MKLQNYKFFFIFLLNFFFFSCHKQPALKTNTSLFQDYKGKLYIRYWGDSISILDSFEKKDMPSRLYPDTNSIKKALLYDSLGKNYTYYTLQGKEWISSHSMPIEDNENFFDRNKKKDNDYAQRLFSLAKFPKKIELSKSRAAYIVFLPLLSPLSSKWKKKIYQIQKDSLRKDEFILLLSRQSIPEKAKQALEKDSLSNYPYITDSISDVKKAIRYYSVNTFPFLIKIEENIKK